MPLCGKQQGVAIGCGARNRLRGDAAIGAGAVVHGYGLAGVVG